MGLVAGPRVQSLTDTQNVRVSAEVAGWGVAEISPGFLQEEGVPPDALGLLGSGFRSKASSSAPSLRRNRVWLMGSCRQLNHPQNAFLNCCAVGGWAPSPYASELSAFVIKESQTRGQGQG